MTYQEDLITHLASYKRARLGDLPAGRFRHRGHEYLYEHILPTANSRLNLLNESRDQIEAYLSANRHITLHRYFHHLNSSQALALNLFIPYFEGGTNAPSALLGALGQPAGLTRWEVEAIPDTAEGSNLDAVWHTDDRVTTYCEVKLSEGDFGKARNDARHLAKLNNIYLPRLAPYLSAQLQTTAGFFGSYQILRNIWHMLGTPKGRLVFLLPRANARLWPLLEAVRAGVTEPIRERIRGVALEDVLDSLASNATAPPLFRDYAERLREKYVPPLPEMNARRRP
jgi:hypothetical protein